MGDESSPLAGQRAVVTGAGGAIGSAAAALLARDGADVLLAGRTSAKLERAAEAASSLRRSDAGSVDWMVVDALDESDVIEMAERAGGATGKVDIAVAVVGGGATPAPVTAQSVESMERTLRTNIIGAFLVLKHIGPMMVRSGAGRLSRCHRCRPRR